MTGKKLSKKISRKNKKTTFKKNYDLPEWLPVKEGFAPLIKALNKKYDFKNAWSENKKDNTIEINMELPKNMPFYSCYAKLVLVQWILNDPEFKNEYSKQQLVVDEIKLLLQMFNIGFEDLVQNPLEFLGKVLEMKSKVEIEMIKEIQANHIIK
jgi:hypothetical protein